MTRDRDFQGSRAQALGDAFSARVDAVFRTSDGLAFGCVVEKGSASRGMRVTVVAQGVVHRATVVSLRRSKWDVDAVAAGDSPHRQFGMIVEPPYVGPLPARVTR